MKNLITLILFLSLLSNPVFVWADNKEIKAGINPGSPFYFIDTFFEKASLFFTFSTESKAKKALSRAEERLAEVKVLASKEKLKNPEIIEKTIAKYEKELAIATEKSKDLKQKEKSEEVLSLILEKTLNHQEVLNSVLQEVPEQAKPALEKAIEVSSKGYDKALGELVVLRQEIENLKKEIEELKQQEQTIEESEFKQLKKEIEDLKKQLGGQKTQQPQSTPFKTQEVQQKNPTPSPIPKETPKEERLTIIRITPDRIPNNTGAIDMVIIGTGFKKGAVVDIGTINKPLTTLINDKEINVRIPGSLIPGTYNLTITNTDGESVVLRDALTIQAPPPPVKNALTTNEVFSLVSPSVVQIESCRGSGSGFVFENQGFILTNEHVVRGCSTVEVKLKDNTILTGQVVGTNAVDDVAVVKVSQNLSALFFGSSDESVLPLGSRIFVLGHAAGAQNAFINEGFINSSGQPCLNLGFSCSGSWSYLTTGKLTEGGGSGGPWVNEKGEVIGLHRAGTQSISWAIPINFVKSVIPSLKVGRSVSAPTSIPVVISNPISTPTLTPTPSVPGTLSASLAPGSPSSKALYWGQNDAEFSRFRFVSTNEGLFVEKITFDTDDSVANFTGNIDSIKVQYKNKSGSTMTTLGAIYSDGIATFGFVADNRPYVPANSTLDILVFANVKSKAARTGQASAPGTQFSINLVRGSANSLRVVGESSGNIMEIGESNSINASNHIIYRAFPEFVQDTLMASEPLGTKDVLKFTIKAHGAANSSVMFDNDTLLGFEIVASGTKNSDMNARLYDLTNNEQVASKVVSNAQSSTTGNRTSILFNSWDKTVEIDAGSQKSFRVEIGFTNFIDKSDFFQLVLKNETGQVSWKTDDVVQNLVPGFIRLLPMNGPIFVKQ